MTAKLDQLSVTFIEAFKYKVKIKIKMYDLGKCTFKTYRAGLNGWESIPIGQFGEEVEDVMVKKLVELFILLQEGEDLYKDIISKIKQVI